MKKEINKSNSTYIPKTKSETIKNPKNLAAEKRQQEKPFNQFDYISKYKKNNYDRIEIILAKGRKSVIKQRAQDLKKSVSEYISDLVAKDLRDAYLE